jgi:hypothetical protein
MKAMVFLIPLLSLGWVNPGPSSPPAGPWIGEDLDAVIQDRFGHITPEDIRKGQLGVSRVAMPEPAHLARRIFKAKKQLEVQALEGLEKDGWSGAMYVLGREGALTGPILTGRASFPEAPDILKVIILGQSAIKAGKGLRDVWGAYTVEARPIPVSGPNCAGCHDPSLKEGDPLGAVVYLFHRTAAP